MYLLKTALVFNKEYHFTTDQKNMDDTILQIA